MADFGRGKLAKTEKGKDMLCYESIRWPGKFLEFIYSSRSRNGESVYWRCLRCFLAKKVNRDLGDVPRITVTNEIIITDPDNPRTPHFMLKVSNFE
ncbi:MAG: hypothetical protein GY820_03765 [Gammaproteobacteria bacterium]|nr:hypothetical protein [Gammaproteobacteria bacterium]